MKKKAGKLSKWMSKELDGHGMFDHAYVTKKLEELTGKKFKLGAFSAGNARSQIGSDPKGPEWVNEKLADHTKLVAGYHVATVVAHDLLGHDPASFINGRGTMFRVCVDALEKAGY